MRLPAPPGRWLVGHGPLRSRSCSMPGSSLSKGLVHHEGMPREAPAVGRKQAGQVGPYGRQPLYWLLRERGITHSMLGATTSRSTSYVGGVLNGFWAPEIAFVSAVSDWLGLPKETLFTPDLLEASVRRADPRWVHGAQARRARVGRFGRQPAYWVLHERRIRQVELEPVVGRSQGQISQVLNGVTVPDPSFLEAVAEFLGLTSAELFTAELIEASRARNPGVAGPPPSRRVGPYGRQAAYWRLREHGIRQQALAAALDRSSGHVSKVLNGFLLPDQQFVEAVSDFLREPSAELFTDEALTSS